MNELRKKIMEVSYKAGASHIGSALSSVEIIQSIYKVKKKKDVFIHSKASGIATWYCHQYQIKKAIEFLKKYPLPSVETGLPISSGSLGHGLSISAGIAYANRKRKVYCLLSDGEMQEGQVWEAILFSAHHKLNNLIAIIDNNKIQALDFTEKVLNIESITHKLLSFNWDVERVDGHDLKSLNKALSIKSRKPLCIVAETIKGKGVSFLENKIEWHYKNITEDEFKKSILELNSSDSSKG